MSDSTTSLCVARDAYNAGCKKVGVSTELAEALWAELSGSASQKIIAGATAPRRAARFCSCSQPFSGRLLLASGPGSRGTEPSSPFGLWRQAPISQ